MRKPAFSGITPSELEWSNASTSQLVFISKFFGCSCISNLYARAQMNPDELEGFYKLGINDKFYFVKVVPSEFSSSLLAGEKIASWLSHKSLSSVVCIAGFPVHDSISGLSVFVYPFYSFRYCQPTTHDLTKIGSYVANMHELLDNYPDSRELEINSWRHHESICRTMKRYTDPSCLHLGQISTVSQILSSIDDTLLDCVFHSPQLIHGDLNAGKISNQSVICNIR